MSKKLLQASLDNLFDSGEEDISPIERLTETDIAGWMWECDLTGHFIHCSPEVEEILGIAPELFTGKSLSSFALSSWSMKRLAPILNQADFPAEITLLYQKSSGDQLPVSITILPSYSEEGEPSGLHGFVVSLLPDREDQEPPQEPAHIELPASPEEIPQEPADTEKLVTLASEIVLDMLRELRLNAPSIKDSNVKRVMKNEKNGHSNGKSYQKPWDIETGGNGNHHHSNGKHEEIEHRLEWGNKFDLSSDEIDFLEKNRYRSSGLRGLAQRLFGKKAIIKCDKKWISVVLSVEGKKLTLWLDIPEVEIELSLSDFLSNPDRLNPILENAIIHPWEDHTVFRKGNDYLE